VSSEVAEGEPLGRDDDEIGRTTEGSRMLLDVFFTLDRSMRGVEGVLKKRCNKSQP
jgi:hypothetical protein